MQLIFGVVIGMVLGGLVASHFRQQLKRAEVQLEKYRDAYTGDMLDLDKVIRDRFEKLKQDVRGELGLAKQ